MVILYIPKPNIPTTLGWAHDGTDWQVATSPAFNDDDIVIESLADTENLLSITFPDDLDSEVTYYCRARVICNKGIFEYSHAEMLKPTDFIKVAETYAIPSMVMTPTISLDQAPMELTSSLFTISTNEISTTSNAVIESTSYVIEDIDGTPVYIELEDRENLYSKTIGEVKLEDGRPYIIKVAHNSSSNDKSSYASQLVYVKDIKDIVLKSQTDNPDIDDGYVVNIDTVTDFKSMRVTLTAVGNGSPSELYTGNSDSLTLVIPKDKFLVESGTRNCLLGIDVTYSNDTTTGIKYYPIKFD